MLFLGGFKILVHNNKIFSGSRTCDRKHLLRKYIREYLFTVVSQHEVGLIVFHDLDVS